MSELRRRKKSSDDLPIGALSLASIENGIKKMVENDRPEIRYLISDEIADAGDADVIFQYITLGELTYG